MDENMVVQQFRAFVYDSIQNGTPPFAFYQQFNEVAMHLHSNLIIDRVCEQLVEVARKDHKVHHILYEYVDVMIQNGVFTMMNFIQLLTKFNNIHVLDVTVSFIRKVTDDLRVIKCDFDDEKERLELCYVYITVVKWLVELACLAVKERIPKQLVLLDEVIYSLTFISTNEFARTIMYFVCMDDNEALIDMLENLSSIEGMLSIDETGDGSYDIECSTRIERLKHMVEDFSRKPEFYVDYLETYRFGANKSEPVILSMCSIFSTFRVLTTTSEMAQSFRNMGQILQYDNLKLVRDLLRGSFVAQLDAYRNKCRPAMADVFVFCRLPEIIAAYKNEFLDSKQLFNCLSELAANKPLFNGVDHYRRDDTFANFLECLQGHRLLEMDHVERLLGERHTSKGDSDLFPDFSNLSMEVSTNEPRYMKLQSAVALSNHFKPLFHREDDSQFKVVLNELLVKMSVDLIDFLIGVLCSRGDLYDFLNVVAEINRSCQSVANEDKAGLHFYDLTVLLLFRIRYLIPDIKLEDLCGGIEDSFIFQWLNNYNNALFSDRHVEPNQQIKDLATVAYQCVKQGTSFWGLSDNFGSLLEAIPVLGEIVVNDFSKATEYEKPVIVEKLLESFGDVSSAYVVYVQWLHMNKSPEKYDIASVVRDNMKKHLKKAHSLKDDNTCKKWRLTEESLSDLVINIAEGPQPHETTYPVLITCAIGDVRPLRVKETPNMTMLKNAFFIASQKGYICQSVLNYVVDLNRKKRYERWIKCWLQQVYKHESVDELEAEAELCFAAALSLPAECFLRLATLLTEDNNFSALSASYPSGYNHIWALARMLVRVLFVLPWVKQQNIDEAAKFNERRRLRRKRRSNNYRRIPSTPDAEALGQAIDGLVKNVIEEFDVVLKKTILDHKKTYASCFIKEITSCPPNVFQKQILSLMPQEMFVNTINRKFDDIHIAAFLNTFGMEDETSRKFCLHIVCLLRKLNKI
uniref:Mediator of RNA polymerase II transcription subunit 24 n=2 Tax=Bursaphelenchus xylophilus TaxID=6326 RepID=A0A1I7RY38_BURXY